MEALIPRKLFTGSTFHTGHAVLVDGDRIRAVLPVPELPSGSARRELDGLLAPGFIDLQVNGGGGVLFNDSPTVEAVHRIGAAHRRFGTTGYLPTVITDRPEVRTAAMRAVRDARALGVPGVLGIHLEGPFLNPARKGVHDPAWMEADIAELETVADPALGRVLVTLAPERWGPAPIRALVAQAVRVAAGHTDGSYDQIREAIDAGLTGFTHLFNAMSPLASREPGAVGAALDSAETWCGLIVDGHHVHDALVRLAWRLKPERLFLVTDAMSPVGTDADRFLLQGRTVRVEGGRCITENGTLAGSALDMATAVRNCVQRVGIPLEAALAMASRIPADYIGLGDRLGHLAPGYAADFVLLDDGLEVLATWIAGRMEA